MSPVAVAAIVIVILAAFFGAAALCYRRRRRASTGALAEKEKGAFEVGPGGGAMELRAKTFAQLGEERPTRGGNLLAEASSKAK